MNLTIICPLLQASQKMEPRISEFSFRNSDERTWHEKGKYLDETDTLIGDITR